MNKRKKYFTKQKLIGLAVLLLTLIDVRAAFITVPIGLLLIFSKKTILIDDYFIESINKNIDKGSY